MNALTSDVVRALRKINHPATFAGAELIEEQELEIAALKASFAALKASFIVLAPRAR